MEAFGGFLGPFWGHLGGCLGRHGPLCRGQCLCEKRRTAPSVTKQTSSAPPAGGQIWRRAATLT
eukprot:4577754-Pyramimonas_sp.AAC.1